MDWSLLVEASGVGVVFLLNLMGVLALVLPGRLDPDARWAGLGRHVEALLILSFASTIYLSGIGNVPVWIDRNGVVAFSLVGAVLPTVLSLRFLWRAGLPRGLLALVGVALTSAVSYVVSQPVAGMGIVARYPFFLLPSITAAVFASILAPRSIRAVPIAYACGSLGALIGGDLVRFQWVVSTQKAIAGSFGGAEFFDLVFLAGLWGAAFAALPLLGYWARLRRPLPEWEHVARLARAGASREGLRAALAIVEARLPQWAAERGLAGRTRQEWLDLSDARALFDGATAALAAGPALPPEAANTLIERLSGLDRRLRRRATPQPAPPGRRTLAAVIDLVPVVVLAVAAYALSPSQEPGPNVPPGFENAARIFFAVSVAVSAHILVPLVSEWAFGGATLGKALAGVRVRRIDGGPPTGWDSLVRNVARLLDLPLFYLIAYASPEFAGRQRLGDYFSGTVVVSERTSHQPVASTPTTMPTTAIHPTETARRAPRCPGVSRSAALKRARK